MQALPLFRSAEVHLSLSYDMRLFHDSFKVLPIGQITPIPVTTTLRRCSGRGRCLLGRRVVVDEEDDGVVAVATGDDAELTRRRRWIRGE